MHKYKIIYIGTNQDTILEEAELSLNYPHSAVFKLKGEVKLIIPYTSILRIERLD